MSIFTNPYDPTYPAGWFKGVKVTVDPAGNADPQLGGGWASFSLGGYAQTWQIVKAAGFSPRYFRRYVSEDWPPATMSRPWSPNGSVNIAAWMDNVKSMGPCTLTVSVTVDPTSDQAVIPAVPAVGTPAVGTPAVGTPGSADYQPASADYQPASAGYVPAKPAEKISEVDFIFYNVVPTTWTAPVYAAPDSNPNKEASFESISFTYNSYDIVSQPSSAGGPSYKASAKGKSAPQAKLRILLGGAKAADPLAALTAWTREGSIIGQSTSAGAQVVDKLSGFDPAISFWLPPETLKIEKGSSWSVSSTPSADGSGPAEWKGTDPMKISFDYVLSSLTSETSQVRNSNNRPQTAGIAGDYDLPADNENIQNLINQLLSLLEADTSIALVTGLRMPPLVMLEFGSFMSPVSYVSKVDLTIQKFDEKGNPQRASGSISLTQYPVPDLLQNPTSGGLAAEDQAIIYDGDSLAHVAYRYYRQPGRWRDLAAANGIDDPMRLTTGSRVGVPSALSLPARTEGGVLKGPRWRDPR